MKVVWVTRSFLDYRIPVYVELNRILQNNLYVIYNADYIPENVEKKVQAELLGNAIGLKGEFKIGPNDFGDFMANKKIRIPFQPGLISKIRELKPDVLISDGFFQWTYSTLWIRIFDQIPHVMCYERTPHTERNAQWYRRFYRRWCTRFIDSYCASGKLCGEYLSSMGVNADSITYGHMTADLQGVQTRDLRNNADRDKLRYLFVGKLIERKGVIQLLENWSVFQKNKVEDVELIIVGTGELKSYVKGFVEENSLSNITLKGHVNYDKMSNIYSDADIFLIPTLEDNWSLVVPEAMANGLPILTSIFNGCHPEYVNQNGWVFNPLDQEDFVSKLQLSFDANDTELATMGLKSKVLIESYTPVHAANSINDAIRLAL